IGSDPISGHKAVWPWRKHERPVSIDARRHSERSANFLNECCLLQFRRANLRKKLPKFPHRLLDGLLARERSKTAGRTHDKLQIAALSLAQRLHLALVVHPMDLAIQQNSVIEICDLTVKPEVHAANGPVLETLYLLRQCIRVISGWKIRQQLLHRFKRQRNDEKLRNQIAGASRDRPL